MNWVRNKAKKAINCGKKIKIVNRKGQERIIARDRKVGARCGDSCSKDCRNFNDDERKNIIILADGVMEFAASIIVCSCES